MARTLMWKVIKNFGDTVTPIANFYYIFKNNLE